MLRKDYTISFKQIDYYKFYSDHNWDDLDLMWSFKEKENMYLEFL